VDVRSRFVLRVRVDRVVWFYDEWPGLLLTLGRSDGADRHCLQNGTATRYGFTFQRDPAKSRPMKKAVATKAPANRLKPAPPLKELGNDPVSGRPMVAADGRYGSYVTDGETNASLHRDDSVEELTDERAAELLADRRARGPVKKKAYS
jgi:hypothetical protein